MATPKRFICLAFVDETESQYHADSLSDGFSGQPKTTYKTNYADYIKKYYNVGNTGFEYFKGIVYPIVRNNGICQAFLLHSMAAIHGKVLTSAEVNAIYTNKYNVKQFITVSNPYNTANLGQPKPGLINHGWHGVFTKTSPANLVFTSASFSSELDNIITS
jgi:hypothetical protein